VTKRNLIPGGPLDLGESRFICSNLPKFSKIFHNLPAPAQGCQRLPRNRYGCSQIVYNYTPPASGWGKTNYLLNTRNGRRKYLTASLKYCIIGAILILFSAPF